MASHQHRERGAAVVEFALIASLILLPLLLGIIQYSIYFYGYQAGANGAREGARAYAVDPCGSHETLISSRVGGAAAGAVTVDPPTFSGTNPPEAGDDVTIRISFAPHDVTGGLIPMPATISHTSTARVEDVQDCP